MVQTQHEPCGEATKVYILVVPDADVGDVRLANEQDKTITLELSNRYNEPCGGSTSSDVGILPLMGFSRK